MSRPRLLDLFCCNGGCSRGYDQAGFDVVGVDLFEDFSQKRYPYWSLKADWRVGLERLGRLADVIHASPPCHRYSITNAARRADYPDLVGPVREALVELGKPYVIENVVGAPLVDEIELCGCMFNLTAIDDDGTPLHMWRPRWFESNVGLIQPRPGAMRLPRSKSRHEVHDPAFHHPSNQVAGAYGGARRNKDEARLVRHGGYVPSKAVQQRLLGIDWMPERAMHQAIPPVYTRFIGARLLDQLTTTH